MSVLVVHAVYKAPKTKVSVGVQMQSVSAICCPYIDIPTEHVPLKQTQSKNQFNNRISYHS